MDLTQLSSEELDDQIERYQDRIETISDYISDDGDPTGVLRNQLAGYRRALTMLREERSRRRANPPAIEAVAGDQQGRNLSKIRFTSTDHIRYENGRDVSGHNVDCKRGIQIEPNIRGGEGYTVTIHNLDGPHPVWGNNVQMAPKQMRVVRETASEVELRGFGHDPMGFSFSDYGLTLHFNGDEVERAVLHMHDRNIDIEYLK